MTPLAPDMPITIRLVIGAVLLSRNWRQEYYTPFLWVGEGAVKNGSKLATADVGAGREQPSADAVHYPVMVGGFHPGVGIVRCGHIAEVRPARRVNRPAERPHGDDG